MGIDVDTAARINTGIREGVYAALSFVPVVGGILGAITNTLWPNGESISTWDEVREDVEKLAKGLIDEGKADDLQKELEGFKRQADDVVRHTEPLEKSGYFVGLRGDAIREDENYCNSRAPWKTMPYFVGMCTFRLTLEKWRIDNWHELYPGKIYNDKAVDEKVLYDLVDRFVAAAGTLRAKCIEYRKSTVKNFRDNGMGYVTQDDIPRSQWEFASRDEQERLDIVARRHQHIEAEYGAKLDAILAPSQLWVWFRPDMPPSMFGSLLGNGKPTPESPFQIYWKRKTVYDQSGPYPVFPKRAIPQQKVESFDDKQVMLRTCSLMHETIRSVTWWTQELRSPVGGQLIGEQVTGIQVVYGNSDGGDQTHNAGIRGKKVSGHGCKEYSITKPNHFNNYLSEVQIVCGDNASKAPIEALAFSWSTFNPAWNYSTTVVSQVGQHDYINRLPANRFGKEIVRAPRATVTGRSIGWYGPPRLAYISGSHIPGEKLVSLSFHWQINQWD